jgi:hypothetical protein
MKVDLTPLKDKLEKRRGVNGQQYYHVDYEVLATFYSADVRYKWRYQGSQRFLELNMSLLRLVCLTLLGEIFDTVKARYNQQ